MGTCPPSNGHLTPQSVMLTRPYTAATLNVYLLIIYTGFNSLTNMGYEMTDPQRLEEIVLCILVVFLQIVLEAYILGTLFHYIVKKDQAVEAFRRRLVMLEDYGAKRDLPMAGGLFRTSTRPTLNRRHLPSTSPRVCMGMHPEGESCSDLGRVLVLNDPTAWSCAGGCGSTSSSSIRRRRRWTRGCCA